MKNFAEMHLWDDLGIIQLREGRRARFRVGRLRFLMELGEAQDSFRFSEEPARDLDKLNLGLKAPYTSLERTSVPINLHPDDSVLIHRGGLVVTTSEGVDRVRTDNFVDRPLAAALSRDDNLRRGQHAAITVLLNDYINIQDLGSQTGTHVFIEPNRR